MEPSTTEIVSQQRPRVVAATVTYGDRWSYLRRTLERLHAEPCVARAIVVANGAREPIAQRVREAGFDAWTDVIESPINRGSAFGYEQALRRALELTDVSHAYLFDDDNLPESGAIERLASLAATCDPATAFVSYRPSRAEHRRLVEEGTPIAMQQANSFLGFSWRSAFARRLQRPGNRKASHPIGMLTGVEYAPYGGFFFALERLAVVGLPRADFVLYVDDHEFTYRFVRSGGRILLSRQSLLDDLEPSWHQVTKKRVPPLFDPDQPAFRVFYSTRNRVAFEREQLVRSETAYWFNAALSLAWGCARARAAGVSTQQLVERGRLLQRAIWAGWNGRLGHDARTPLPGS